jgi:CubicO group peptidase (beta-lactamase class C family)
MLEIDTPRAVGLDPERWKTALKLLHMWCDDRQIPAAGIAVARGGKTTGVHLFGRQTLALDAPAVRPDAIFLIASITKPIVAMGALLLVERGLLALDDRVEEYVPAFGREGKHAVTVRNLLTHTSGLPDMLPNNIELRAANAPLSEFVAGTCGSRLDFLPGRGVQYQSMGLAMLGEVISRVSGKSCAQFLLDELFTPLGMNDTALGAPESWFEEPDPKVNRIAEVWLPPDSEQARETSRNWNWNSRYWRTLGVPWGGLLTTPADLAQFGQMMLGQGRTGDVQIVSRAAVKAATRNQLEAMPDVPEGDRRARPWGLGWRLNWPAHSANFGDFLGPRTYGHWGATGTLMWIDPDLDACVILLTTKPQEPHGNYLARASNAIVAAMV